MFYCSPFVTFVSLSCVLADWFEPDLDLMVFVIVHTPWPISKGLGHPYLHVYVCVFLCFMLMLASLVLSFATFDTLSGFVVVWLHLTPMRPCLDVTIWDASPWCRLLPAYFPLFYFMQWHTYHVCLRHLLAFYASLHACSHVHAWVLLASVSSILQHNEAMDIWSKPAFIPRGHDLLFAFLLSCLYVYLCLSCLPPHAMLAISILLVCFCTLLHTIYASLSFHCLSTGFLALPFACIHTERGHMELGHDLLGVSKKGEDASM